MGLPLILTAFSAVGSIVGGITSAEGAEQQAHAQAAEQTYQAQVAANNAVIAENNAKLTAAAGEQAATNQELKTRQTTGQIKSAIGASGVDVNTGSAPNVIGSNEELGSLDAASIRQTAADQAYGYETEATSETATSQLSTMGAANSLAAGNINATSSLLGGATSAAGTLGKQLSIGGAPVDTPASPVPSDIGMDALF